MRRLRMVTVWTALAAGVLVAPVASYAVGTRAAECLVSGQRSGGSMSLRITCDGPGGTLSSPWDATATWSGDVDSLAGGSGSVSLTGFFGTYAGACGVRRAAGTYWSFDCTATDGHQTLGVRWGVAETPAGLLVGEGTLSEVSATGGPPVGEGCDFVTTDGWVGDDSTYAGTLSGGPLVAPGSEVSITCSIRTAQTNQHSASALLAVTSGPHPDYATLPPQPVSFVVPPDGYFPVLCTSATVDGTTWYWTDTYGYTYWTRDASTRCQQITSEGYPPPSDYVLWHAYEIVDFFVCPVLEVAFAGGDITGLWDCPPYGS